MNKTRAAEKSPPIKEKGEKMPTNGEMKYMQVVQSSLNTIAKELERTNKLTALKLRAQLDESLLCKDALAELDEIMGSRS